MEDQQLEGQRAGLELGSAPPVGLLGAICTSAAASTAATAAATVDVTMPAAAAATAAANQMQEALLRPRPVPELTPQQRQMRELLSTVVPFDSVKFKSTKTLSYSTQRGLEVRAMLF